MAKKLIVVCGAGGFIGGHLVAKLRQDPSNLVRAVDIKPFREWFRFFPELNNHQLDLQKWNSCGAAVNQAQVVYNLACNMSGMGFIEKNRALCSRSVLINAHLLLAAQSYARLERYFYASSACVYPAEKQTNTNVIALRESDAIPAEPEKRCGWEKLFSEQHCMDYRDDFGVPVRIARFHNVYGPYGTWNGGHEKAPAAICRKVIEAKISGKHEIKIEGDGEQTRSFTHIDDCLIAMELLMHSDFSEPLNIGSSELVTVNQLVTIAENIAGIKLKRNYNPSAPLSVRGRNSDNALIKSLFNWEPSTKLTMGLETTYQWIYDQMIAQP
ncbi:MAG: NAD-dependent epimerase/dehydratase family protein [bacterium]|nr:NAD-dependent epimerase/dehydratase family protein [bacterium]